LEKVYLGPDCEEYLESLKPTPKEISPGVYESTESVKKRLKEHKVAFRMKCLDFYTTAAKEINKRLPMKSKLFHEMAFVDPQVLLSPQKRVDDDGLPDLSTLGNRFKVKLLILNIFSNCWDLRLNLIFIKSSQFFRTGQTSAESHQFGS